MGAGCSCSGKNDVQEPTAYDADWCYVSSSDEEYGVPPIPIGSDDGTVLFCWTGDTPRKVGGDTPGENDVPDGTYAVGDILEYKHCMRVQVMEINDETGSTIYTVRLPDNSSEHTVGHRLSLWTEDIECKSHAQLRINAAMETATVVLPVKRLPSLITPLQVPDSDEDFDDETKEDYIPPAALRSPPPLIVDSGEGISHKWSMNEGGKGKGNEGRPKKKGLRFGSDQVHQFDKHRAANTHLSMEEPLNLPMVPFNSIHHGFPWENQMPSVHEEGPEADSDEELDAELQRQMQDW